MSAKKLGPLLWIAYERVFTFDALPKLQTGQGYWTTAAGERKRWKRRVAEMLNIKRARPPEPLQLAYVIFLRASSVEPDDDNLSISFKGVRDAFVTERVLSADDPQHLISEYHWVQAKPRHGHIVVAIKEVSP